MRRAGRRDANHAEIVAAHRLVGQSVWDTAGVGHGFPDIIVGTPTANRLHEIKVLGNPLTDDEREFFATWQGPKAVVYSIEDSLVATGISPGVAARVAEVVRARRGKPARKSDVQTIRAMLGA